MDVKNVWLNSGIWNIKKMFDFNNYRGGFYMAKRNEVPSWEYCVCCGRDHECDSLSYTKRKTYVYWNSDCLRKELDNERAKRNNQHGEQGQQ